MKNRPIKEVVAEAIKASKKHDRVSIKSYVRGYCWEFTSREEVMQELKRQLDEDDR
jgi:hypothetical protein